MRSVYLIFLSLFCVSLGAKLPSQFKVCQRNDPKLEECFAKAIEDALKYVKDGVPELGLGSADPIRYESITIRAGSSDSINMVQKLSDIKIYNVVNSKVNKTEIQVTDKKFNVVVYLYTSLLKVEADYELEGKFLLLPFVGNGKANIDMYDMDMVFTLNGEFYEKKGKTYVKFNDVTVKVKPLRINYNFENLFNGNEQLGSEMNKLLSENWKEVYEDVRKPYEDAIAAFCKKNFQQVFNKVAFNDLFP